ncbi:MAG: beta-lactamase family protein [Porphyrobacter sp.]|jgi:D-alanyl-D-alanine carboxypeptidase|nr:beta-lactamase family protein [Porphyrobacter sp.]
MNRLSLITLIALAFSPQTPLVANETTASDALVEITARTAARIQAAAYVDVFGCGLNVSTVAGVADRTTGAPAPLDAPLRIGSVGKLYTAATLHRLAERGAINLDEPVSRMLLPGDAADVAGRTATLRQLLNHTGGVPDYYALPDIRKWDMRQPLTPPRILTAIAGRKATSPPGGAYSYSNSGYHLAALAVERAVGQPLAAMMEEEVIALLGLAATIYHESAPAGPLHGYVGRDDQWESAENTGPDSGITATLADLRKSMRALFLEDGPLRPAGVAMTADPVETDRPRFRAGAGAEVRESREGMALVGHTGDVEGYLTFAYAAPAYDLTIIGHITASDKAALTELLRTVGSIATQACKAGHEVGR